MASLQKLGIGQTISDLFGMAKPQWEKSPGLLVSSLSQLRCHNYFLPTIWISSIVFFTRDV